ncbi:hypothetical protein KM043_014155 [Ampulex compressa]|nr:hypothetical protein KM043_014155 [Ampulex compressa]
MWNSTVSGVVWAQASQSTKQNMDAVEINESDPSQNEEGIVSTVEICRVCLLGNLVMRDLFLENEVASLSAKAMSFANVKMLPGDGLPPRVCRICADKLESAYEFKLQVEQADSVLRERYDTMNMKEELFFNEVEVHLEADRSDNIDEMHVESHYEPTVAETLDQEQSLDHEEKSSLLKEEFALLEVEKLSEREQMEQEHDTTTRIKENINKLMEGKRKENLLHQEDDTVHAIMDISKNQVSLKCGGMIESTPDSIAMEEHNYIMQQDCMVPREQQNVPPEESFTHEQSTAECTDTLTENKESDIGVTCEEEMPNGKVDPPPEQESVQNETRRSKRKLVRRTFTSERDSDEENYFENLNLSSRLKKAQADKSEKVFFMCYLCDKQFLSKNVLKEHMHSHEEVRRALSLKKTPEKPQKTTATVTKMPPSGKRANKCPYCGKEYLYIISFSKHLKQHEREKEESKEDPMPLEISFHEDEHSLDFNHCNSSRYSDLENRKRSRRENTGDEDNDGDDQDEYEKEKLRKRRMETFSCDKCSEKFHTKRGLQKHALTHISFKCSVCDEEYDSLEKLKGHRTKHVVEGVLTEQDLEEDMKQMASKEMEYDEVNKEDEDADEREEYANSGHRKDRYSDTQSGTNYTCKVCCQEFTKKDQLRRHAEQHGRIKSFKCTQCNKTFGNELTLRNHLIATNHKTFIHGQEYDPNKRIKRVAAKAAQKIIDKIKTEDGLEDYDDEDNNDSADLDEPYSRKRESSQKKYNYKKELECATCNKRCSSKQSLTKHMEQHVKDEKNEKLDKLDKLKKSTEKKENQRTCNDMMDDDDDDNSDFESGLDWPMDNHECTTCKKKYSTKKSLLRHQLLHEEPNFECDICNVKFYRKDKLKAHYDKCSEKNPDQVRKCNICGDSFENNEILREHRAKHVTEGILTEEDLRDIEPRPEEKKPGEKIGRKRRTDIVGLECTECNKQYTSRKGLLRHIQVHEGKKYLCDICPKKFYRREHLKIHVAKHNMIKPYKCSRCTKRFIKEEQLTNHLSKHDRTFKKNKETDSSKRFLCEICSKSFTQSTTLIAHLRAHNGIKPYVCENRTQTLTQVQPQNPQRVHQTLGQAQVVKAQNIKTITIARQAEPVTTQQVMQHQEILMPLILPLTVTLTDVGEEVILPEVCKLVILFLSPLSINAEKRDNKTGVQTFKHIT